MEIMDGSRYRLSKVSWTDIFRVMRIVQPIKGVPRFLSRGIECANAHGI